MRKKSFVKKALAVALGLSLAVTGVNPLGVSGVSIERVEAAAEVNILNYESNKSASNYVITDVAGMEKLAELVNNGTESFSGKTVTLQADLKYDKTIENNHTVIGNGYFDVFCGTFNGQNHKISGINMNSGEDYVGLFGHSAGIIDGICLEDSIIVQTNKSQEGMTGGIAGRNANRIRNCVIMQNVEIVGRAGYSFVGGIAGYTFASEKPNITECVNYGIVKGAQCVGGIVGEYGAYLDGIVIGTCCNFGTVQSNNSNREIFVGGIAGCNRGGIVNCFNAGVLISGGDAVSDSAFGGIAGLSELEALDSKAPLIANCYNVGQVFQGKNYGAITCASARSKAPGIANCYWLQGTSSAGVNTANVAKGLTCDLKSVYQYSQTKMKVKAFVDTLNKNSMALGYGEVWEEDVSNINNGYPILKGLPYAENAIGSGDEITDNGIPVSNLFKDYDYIKPVTDETIQLYANGGIVTGANGVKRNTRSQMIYTDILASYIYNLDKKGNVVPSIGKVIVGVTSDNTVPVLVKGKIVDKEAAKIAKAAIKNGRITVTAQSQTGRVYLWVMDTGKKKLAASCPITVKMAPAALTIWDKPYTDTTAKRCTSTSVKAGGAVYVYLKPVASDKKTITTDCTYQAVVSEAAKAYVTVSATTDPCCFKISGISKKAKGTTKVSVKFACKQSPKSASVSVIVK